MTNFEAPWTDREEKLANKFIDDRLNDPHHIRDWIVHLKRLAAASQHQSGDQRQLSDPFPEPEVDLILRRIDPVISFIVGELARFPEVTPDALRPPGRFPHVRQMRDVHCFDVGSHLLLCYMLATRLVPISVSRMWGLHRLADGLQAIVRNGTTELAECAILHDIFKPLRGRRALPSKLGPRITSAYRRPDGSEFSEDELADETKMAASCLSMLRADTEHVVDVLRSAAAMNECLYLAIKQNDHQAAVTLAANFADAHESSAAYLHGLYVGISDTLGKGHSSEVVTTRHGGKRTLLETLELVLTELDRRMPAVPRTQRPNN